jgi:mRNA capping family enzyme
MDILNMYNGLLKKFIGVQPITFNNVNYSKTEKYFLTYKLDGLRSLLIIDSHGNSNLVNNKLETYPFKIPIRDTLIDTILDGELLNNKFYVFDILRYSGKDVRKSSMFSRIELLHQLSKILKSRKVTIKKYLSPYDKSICENFEKLRKSIDPDDYVMIDKTRLPVDGIIFVSDSEYSKNPLKWKDTKLLTIDFKIKKISSNEIQLLTQSGQIFKPKQRDLKNIGTVKVPSCLYSELNDGEVVEFAFDKKRKTFKVLRKRPDKITSNHIKVILDNLNTILNPPNPKKILCDLKTS